MSHSPDSWTAVASDPEHGDPSIHEANLAPGTPVYEIENDEGLIALVLEQPGGMDNTRLIAAAPTLLKALQKAAKALEYLGNVTATTDEGADWLGQAENLLSFAAPAIAKATGASE